MKKHSLGVYIIIGIVFGIIGGLSYKIDAPMEFIVIGALWLGWIANDIMTACNDRD